MSNANPDKSALPPPQTVPPPETAELQKKELASEEIGMRQAAFHFVASLCIFSELVSVIIFFVSRSIEAATVFQIPALLCLYRILCYLFPTQETSVHPIVVFLQALFRHNP